MASHLESLPNEILVEILRHVSGERDLLALVAITLSSRKFYHLVGDNAEFDRFQSASWKAGFASVESEITQPSRALWPLGKALIREPEKLKTREFALVHHASKCALAQCRESIFGGLSFPPPLTKKEIRTDRDLKITLSNVCAFATCTNYRDFKTVSARFKTETGNWISAPLYKHINLFSGFATSPPISYARIIHNGRTFPISHYLGLTNAAVIYKFLRILVEEATSVARKSADKAAMQGYDERYDTTYNETFDQSFSDEMCQLIGCYFESQDGTYDPAHLLGFSMQREEGIIVLRPNFGL